MIPGAANPLLLGADLSNYQIQRSLRFRAAATAYLNRTPAGAGSAQKFTYSLWVKRGNNASDQTLISAGVGGNRVMLIFDSTGYLRQDDSGITRWQTNAIYRDPTAWYHIVWAVDTTQATASNRNRVYVNGVEITSFSSNTTLGLNFNWPDINTAVLHRIGLTSDASNRPLDGYLAEVRWIDGQQLTPSSFGQIDTTTGQWTAKKYTGSYGTNGYYLDFSDTSSTTNLCLDRSGNANNWTPNNISLTAGSNYDSMTDVPLAYGTTDRGNCCVMSPIDQQSPSSPAPTNGNLTVSTSSMGCNSTLWMNTAQGGLWYAECTQVSNSNDNQIGINGGPNYRLASPVAPGRRNWRNGAGSTVWLTDDSTAGAGTATALASGDTLAIAVDLTNKAIYFGRIPSGSSTVTWMNSGVPTSGASKTGAIWTDLANSPQWAFNSNANANGLNVHWNFGQRPWQISALPTGYKPLHTGNLPAPTILQPNKHFDATIYTGNGSTQSIVNSGAFQPDLVWVKSRSNALDHKLTDSVRGATKGLISNTAAAETTDTNGVTAFNSNGFALGTDATYNTNAASFVAWQWKKGATPGFDVVAYTGNGANRTVAHAAGIAPSFIVIKSRSSATDWTAYHAAIGNTNKILLNSNGLSVADTTAWNSTSPSGSVFSLGTQASVNTNAATYVAYLFAEIAGFSKFGSYAGNSSTDGPFVFCGFRPRWILRKATTNSPSRWILIDTARDIANVGNDGLFPHLSGVEEISTTNWGIDVLSNGFKLRTSDLESNRSGDTYIFAAFAETPFQFALAR